MHTDDPQQPKLVLTIRANVVGSVDLLPRQKLNLGNHRNGALEGQLLIRKDRTERGELNVTALETSVPWLRANVERLEAPREFGGRLPAGVSGDWLLNVNLAADAENGTTHQQVKFRTGLPRQPEVSIPITVILRPAVNLSKAELVLSRPAPGETSRGVVMAVVRRGLDPQQLRVEADPPEIKVHLQSTGPRHFRVQVDWSSEDGRPDDGGTIVFRIGENRLTLPVQVTPGP